MLLPRLVSGSFERSSEDRVIRMMFVAVTQAARWVYLSTVAGQEAPFLARLAPLLAAGDPMKRQQEENGGQVQAPAAVSGTPDLGNLFA